MGLNEDVGRRLRALRRERELSLSELARRSGVGKGTLSELESGSRNPTLETLYALTTALGLPLSAALAEPPATAGPGPARTTVSGSAVTIPSRYYPLSVTREYLGLTGGPARFTRDFSG
ncbi:helix-turn-helix domain-containing protein, partial [Streptomyces sp. NPDC001478]